MAVDFLTALIDYWEAEPTTTAAGIGTLHRDTARSPYPYAVVTLAGAKDGVKVFGGGGARNATYRINIFQSSQEETATLGRVAEAALAPITTNPDLLPITGAKLLNFFPAGDALVKTAQAGKDGKANIWMASLAYEAQTWKG